MRRCEDAWTNVEASGRHVGYPSTPGDEVADNVGVGAVRDDEIGARCRMSHGTSEAREISAAPHPRTGGLDALSAKLVEEGPLVDECQHPDAETALAQRRNQKRPLPLGTGDIESGADKEDCSRALHVRRDGRGKRSPTAWLLRHHHVFILRSGQPLALTDHGFIRGAARLTPCAKDLASMSIPLLRHAPPHDK